MTDERAVTLANLLAEYARASAKEGATLAEVGAWTVRSVLSDIVDTTPDYLSPRLDEIARTLAEGCA